MMPGKAGLVFEIFFRKSENNYYEAGFAGFCACFARAEKSPALTLEKSGLKRFSDFRKKTSWQKPTLPCNFSLGHKTFISGRF
jgi:hypothetical protein